MDGATFYSPIEARATPTPTSKSPEERQLAVDSGASMHMLSKKDLSSDEMEDSPEIQEPTTVVTANGKVQTNEEAQVYVHDLDLFVTRLQFDHLESSAKNTDILVSEPAVKSHT